MEFEFKHPPFQHQQEFWEQTRDLREYAVFWEQGTGKSKATIDTGLWQYVQGTIDAVLVLAPNGIHRNWVTDEIPEHVPEALLRESRYHFYQSAKAGTKWHQRECNALLEHKGLAWLAMSYDAFMTEKGKKFAWSFLRKRQVLYVLDESARIKTPGSKRTKAVVASGKYGRTRRVLTGTPVTQGPFDVFAPMRFLNEGFWKPHELHPFGVFKNHFGQFVKQQNRDGSKEWDQLVGFRRLGELQSILAPVSSRVLKADVLDLPDKLYQKRYFEPTREQRRLYDSIRQEFAAYIPGEDECPHCAGSGRIEYGGWEDECGYCMGTGRVISSGAEAPLAITRLLRLQQIMSGYLPVESEDPEAEPVHVIPGANPRLELLKEVIEGTPGKVIVWGRFQLDIELMHRELTQAGIPAVKYYGPSTDDERAEALNAFRGWRPIMEGGKRIGKEPIAEEGQAKVFIGSPAAAGEGLTMTEASTVVYYNNSFKLSERLQSEDRAHRIGQTNNVTYIDIVAPGTIDDYIVKALRSKMDVANAVTGDAEKEWI